MLALLHREREDLSELLEALLDVGLASPRAEVFDEEVVGDADRIALPVLLDCEDRALPLDLLDLEQLARHLDVSVPHEGVASGLSSGGEAHLHGVDFAEGAKQVVETLHLEVVNAGQVADEEVALVGVDLGAVLLVLRDREVVAIDLLGAELLERSLGLAGRVIGNGGALADATAVGEHVDLAVSHSGEELEEVGTVDIHRDLADEELASTIYFFGWHLHGERRLTRRLHDPSCRWREGGLLVHCLFIVWFVCVLGR